MKTCFLALWDFENTEVYGRLWETKAARSPGMSLKLCVFSSMAIPAVTGSQAAAGARVNLWGPQLYWQGAVTEEAEAQLELVGAGRWISLQHFSCLDPGSSQHFKPGTH